MRPGNRLRALVDGPEIMRRIGQAIGEARHSIWATIAFYSEEFSFPDGRGSLFDVLDGAVGRGVDVRLLIWRSTPESPPGRIFDGLPQQRALLARRGSRFKIRWDKAAGPFCQHQKSWVIDAGQPCERRANIECDPRVPARDRRFLSRQANHSICREFSEASDGLEQSTPSLP